MFPRERMQLLASEESKLPPEVSCESLGPGLPGSDEPARLWDRITLTDDEDRVIGAVNLAMDEAAERVAVVGDSGGRGGQGPNGRRLVVRIEDQSHPVPLKSLGDGAERLLGVALALVNSRDGSCSSTRRRTASTTPCNATSGGWSCRRRGTTTSRCSRPPTAGTVCGASRRPPRSSTPSKAVTRSPRKASRTVSAQSNIRKTSSP